MDKRRTLIIALALAALLCVASCSGTSENSSENQNAGEMPAAGSANTSGTPQAGPQSVRVIGGKPPASAIEEAHTRPFIVLITKSNCPPCVQLESEMEKAWKEKGSQLPFFVLYADDPNKTGAFTPSEVAAKLDVEKFAERGEGAPWAGTFKPDGKGHSALLSEAKANNPQTFNKEVADIMASIREMKVEGQAVEDDASRGGYEKRFKDIEGRLAKIDGLEAQLAKLEKDLEQIKGNNNGLTTPRGDLDKVIQKQQSFSTVVIIVILLLVLALALSVITLLRLSDVRRKQQEQGSMDRSEISSRLQALNDRFDESLDAMKTKVIETEINPLKETVVTKLDGLETRVAAVEKPSGSEVQTSPAITDETRQQLVREVVDDVSLDLNDELAGKLFGNQTFNENFERIFGEKLDRDFDDRLIRGFDEKFDRRFKEKLDQEFTVRFTEQMNREFGLKFEQKFGQAFDAKIKPVSEEIVTKLQGQIQEVVANNEREITNIGADINKTSASVAEMAQWLSSMQVAAAGADGSTSEAERRAAISTLEQYLDRLRENANHVAPLVAEMKTLAECASTSQRTPPGVVEKLKELQDGIKQYDRWLAEAGQHLASLQGDSFSVRREQFKKESEFLKFQFQEGSLPVTEFTKGLRELHDKHFPAGAQDGHQSPVTINKEELERKASDITEYLMDWFSDFYRVQTQLQYAQEIDNSADAEVLAGMGRVKEAVREVLSNFDIQPDEIQIGQTQYDRNLHDLIYTRESMYQPRTIIEVEKSGFSRRSNGNSLRRPQVIVAGTGVG